MHVHVIMLYRVHVYIYVTFCVVGDDMFEIFEVTLLLFWCKVDLICFHRSQPTYASNNNYAIIPLISLYMYMYMLPFDLYVLVFT